MRTLTIFVAIFPLLAPVLSAQERAIMHCNFGPSPIARFDKQMTVIRAKNGIVRPRLAEGENIAVRFPRSEARPQDRWLAGEIEIRSELGELSRMKLEVALFGIDFAASP